MGKWIYLADLCEFDIVLSALGESLVLRCGLKSCVGGLDIALTGSDDSLQITLARALCVSLNEASPLSLDAASA